MTGEEIVAVIRRHAVNLDAQIEKQYGRIRETYDTGKHTNVDAARAAIDRFEYMKLALAAILSEIGEEV